jgi:D-alanyl-D-alanine carboxypeptidase
MNRTIVSMSLCLAVVVCCFAAGATPVESARSRGLAGDVDALLATGVPGAIVSTRRGDRVQQTAYGLGRKVPRTAMRTTDRFRIASLTKTFVASIVLQLTHERKLSLNDSVELWLPGALPNGRAITILSLLNHTSGVYDYWQDERFFKQLLSKPVEAWPPGKLIEIAAAHPPLFAPGAKWSYSNTNYILAGLIIEKATGRSLSTELRERLFVPLGLRDTRYPEGPRIDGAHARGYLVLNKPPAQDVTAVTPSAAGAAGALVSTAGDVSRFYRALLTGRVLPPALLREMQTTVATGKSFQYGLGLARFTLPCGVAWGHQGEFAGYLTIALTSATGQRQAVVFANTLLNRNQERLLERVLETAYCRR